MCPGQVVSWFKCHPMNQKIIDLISGQGTHLGCESIPIQGKCVRQTIEVSPTLMFLSHSRCSLPSSLKIQQKHILG